MSSPSSTPSNDPFREARRQHGVLACPFHGEEILMLLRHGEIRRAAKNWETFSSDAPFRVPIPSEEEFRRMRQLPIETDPPVHTDYRKIVEPFFKRARDPHVIAQVEALFDSLLDISLARDAVEIVHDLALPAQSRALAHLLNVPESEAEIWIGWGMHVFGDKNPGQRAGDQLECYLQERLDRAEADPGDDFFSALTQARFHDRPLTRDEMMGFANLTFAGGRDTLIHTISAIVHHLACHPASLAFLREDPRRVDLASEEFFRVASPLTHIGRVCPQETEVRGVSVAPGQRVSLCWASANHDESVFDAPHETRLDRKPNPHLAFGAGPHLCLGAAHARLVVRSLLRALCDRVAAIEVLASRPLIEREAHYSRANGFESLTVRFSPGKD